MRIHFSFSSTQYDSPDWLLHSYRLGGLLFLPVAFNELIFISLAYYISLYTSSLLVRFLFWMTDLKISLLPFCLISIEGKFFFHHVEAVQRIIWSSDRTFFSSIESDFFFQRKFRIVTLPNLCLSHKDIFNTVSCNPLDLNNWKWGSQSDIRCNQELDDVTSDLK